MLLIKDNKILINFNKKFYSRKSLIITKKDYANICTTTINNDKNYFQIELIPLNEEIELKKLGLEFSNYVLSLQK